jgi:hypothetical protein
MTNLHRENAIPRTSEKRDKLTLLELWHSPPKSRRNFFAPMGNVNICNKYDIKRNSR